MVVTIRAVMIQVAMIRAAETRAGVDAADVSRVTVQTVPTRVDAARRVIARIATTARIEATVRTAMTAIRVADEAPAESSVSADRYRTIVRNT